MYYTYVAPRRCPRQNNHINNINIINNDTTNNTNNNTANIGSPQRGV